MGLLRAAGRGRVLHELVPAAHAFHAQRRRLRRLWSAMLVIAALPPLRGAVGRRRRRPSAARAPASGALGQPPLYVLRLLLLLLLPLLLHLARLMPAVLLLPGGRGCRAGGRPFQKTAATRGAAQCAVPPSQHRSGAPQHLRPALVGPTLLQGIAEPDTPAPPGALTIPRQGLLSGLSPGLPHRVLS
jgi:hypothetical protein